MSTIISYNPPFLSLNPQNDEQLVIVTCIIIDYNHLWPSSNLLKSTCNYSYLVQLLKPWFNVNSTVSLCWNCSITMSMEVSVFFEKISYENIWRWGGDLPDIFVLISFPCLMETSYWLFWMIYATMGGTFFCHPQSKWTHDWMSF